MNRHTPPAIVKVLWIVAALGSTATLIMTLILSFTD